MTSGGARADYRFVRELAAGGMGRIELVIRREGAFARPYARKRLSSGSSSDGTVRAMFVEEARVAGLVRHAHVVPVLDVGEDEDGPFLVMELIDGISVDALIRRVGDRLPAQVAVEIARQMAEGIHAAHELVSADGAPMELVHRDLTPSNVLIGFDGIVRVTDFGVAKVRDRASLTRAGVPKGKRSYMAPEQIREEAIDRRTDLFALGVVLAEMLRGGSLHGDASASEITRRTLEEPPPDPGDERDDLPPELVALSFELMARDPDDRPRDAHVVAMRLGAIHSTLRSEEGPIDLGELVRARFDDVRRAHQEMIAEALCDRDPTQLEIALPPARGDGEGLESPSLADVPTVRESGDSSFHERVPESRRAPSMAAFGAVASVVALAVAASALWAATRANDASTEASPIAVAHDESPPERPTIEHDDAITVSAAEVEVDLAPQPSDPEVTAESRASASARERVRRARARARAAREDSADRAPRDESSTAIRTWSWE